MVFKENDLVFQLTIVPNEFLVLVGSATVQVFPINTCVHT